MTRRQRRAFLRASGIAGVSAMTGLAGCTLGGNDSGDTDSTADGGGDSSGGGSSTDSGGGSSQESITIAATVPLSGQFSSVGQDLKRGYELGAARMNNNDELGDVNLVLQDDQSDPKTVRDKLTKIISNNDVDMIWSTFADLLVGSQIQIAEQKGIPLIAIAQSNEKLHTNSGTKWLFSPFPQTRDHVASTKRVLDSIPEADRPTNVGLWVPNESWSVAMADEWEKQLSGDYDIVLRETHQVAASDFSTLIQQSKSAGVEALLGTETPVGGITAMKQINEADFSPKFQEFVRAADTVGWNSALGEQGRYVCMSPGWVPGLTGNGNADLVQSYHDAYDVGSGETLPVMVGATYNATQVAEQAFLEAGTTDKAAVQETLRSGTFTSVCGEFSFDDVGRPVDFVAPMGQWQEGAQHLVYPETDGEEYRDLVYPIPT
ncbi:ABC transporter substrate-binding protein [Halobaculum sp. D14]|uniref:ABC transporter substrate-binding protein n=1 Tax=Halobaculum sp. D14 TaxID=3421642 RepID=UPI003EBF22E0